jgi:hypothetical protein
MMVVMIIPAIVVIVIAVRAGMMIMMMMAATMMVIMPPTVMVMTIIADICAGSPRMSVWVICGSRLVALHSDFDGLGPAVKLAPAGLWDQ